MICTYQQQPPTTIKYLRYLILPGNVPLSYNRTTPMSQWYHLLKGAQGTLPSSNPAKRTLFYASNGVIHLIDRALLLIWRDKIGYLIRRVFGFFIAFAVRAVAQRRSRATEVDNNCRSCCG
jgi:hypothetical protein